MSIAKVPNSYFKYNESYLDLFVYDFKMDTEIVKSKIDLSMHMFSFLQEGRKQVHFDNTSIAVNKDQSLILKKGNCLWTELLDTDEIYYCKLFFFSDKMLKQFLNKHKKEEHKPSSLKPYFAIKNDRFIKSYLDSLANIMNSIKNETSVVFIQNMLQIKFEEIMLYLLNKYGSPFEAYLCSLIKKEISLFDKIIENSIDSSLKLEEIAFLSNMSLSTFKRHFKKEYNKNPGKWLLQKRLLRAKSILETGKYKPSEIYYKYGYTNLSNFSTAYKSEFGISPKQSCNK